MARAWHGKTLRAKADEYEQYLGGRIVNMPKIEGNLGFHRLDPPSGGGDYVEFEVVSYWPSLQAIEASQAPTSRPSTTRRVTTSSSWTKRHG